MSKENQNKKYDGQNRCRRCDRPLSDPNDIYGWRCAQIVGANKYNEIASMLDEDSLNVYNAYVSTYLVDDNKTITDNSGKLEKVAWMDSVKEGAEWIGNKLYDAWNWGEDNIWKGIAAGMKAVGYELTADLLSLFVNPLSQDSVVKGILWAANDIAYFDTKWGLLDSVDVKIKFSNFY